ncbi:SDR family oxidoreductase [Novosphingobium lindaniclasticum]|uniref:SDR family oxidoreductase n=1 Tax=Novosphingobium lindaniclasticum TaxID=1329895 RepID=UPI001268501C|nr:SDR family oxidoreductase [Novosphingobium lindaniclasticum]
MSKTDTPRERRRTAVITGASSGIGQATAEAFETDSWNLVLAARRREDLETVAAHCRDAGAQVLAVPADVGDAEAVRKLAKIACEFADPIDPWFSNVGVGAVGKFLDVPMATHDQIVRSNLIGHMNDAHAALPIFIEQGHGVFVNMISLGGFAAAPFAAAYSASKFRLKGFSEALRAELADYPDVHICDVYPSFVDTPAILHAGNYTGKALSAPPPLLDPRTVAAAVVRLADHPRSAVILGSPSWASRLSHFIAPSLNARGIKGASERYFAQAEPAPITNGNVLTPPDDGVRIGGGLRSPSQRRGDRGHGRFERTRARWSSTHDAQNGAPRLIPNGPTFEMSAPSVPTALAADGKREEAEPATEILAGQQRRMRRQEVGWVPVLTITMPLNLVARRGQLPLAREECH